MSGIDYEAEYNNRARVPEHPRIFEGYIRDAEAYRGINAPQRIPYGTGERQSINLFQAPDPDHGAKTVVFVHGAIGRVSSRGSSAIWRKASTPMA